MTDCPSKEHSCCSRNRSEAMDKPKNLTELIQGLHCIFKDDKIDTEKVKEYLSSYKSVKEDWVDKAIFNEHRYTRHLIDEGNGKFDLILLCWGEGQKSPIHDHSNSHCFMKMLEGTLTETMYSWPTDDAAMLPTESVQAKSDDVLYINDEIGLHLVANKTSKNAVSLHLYSPPFHTCQTFDGENGRKVKCQVTFYSKFGERVTNLKFAWKLKLQVSLEIKRKMEIKQTWFNSQGGRLCNALQGQLFIQQHLMDGTIDCQIYFETFDYSKSMSRLITV